MDRVITSPSLPSFFSPPPCFWYLVANGNNRETTFPPILNGSGIAAISTTYGNKHLFFQDETSAIRTSILIDDTWLNSNAWSGVEKARLQTPLQTVGYVWNDREYIDLYYITPTNNLARLSCSKFVKASKENTIRGTISCSTSTSNYSTSSAHLSVSLIPNASSTGSNTPPDIILILENQTGTAEVIRGHQKDSQEKEIGVFVGEDFLKWRNVTDDVMKILTKDEKGNVRLVAPFATSSSGENGIVRLWSLDQEMGWMREVRMMNNTWSIGGIAWLAPRNCSASPTYTFPPSAKTDLILPPPDEVDFPIGLYINNTSLTPLSLTSASSTPSNSTCTICTSPLCSSSLPNNFTHSRLATIPAPQNIQGFYLYHQLNSHKLVEEIWDGRQWMGRREVAVTGTKGGLGWVDFS